MVQVGVGVLDVFDEFNTNGDIFKISFLQVFETAIDEVTYVEIPAVDCIVQKGDELVVEIIARLILLVNFMHKINKWICEC